MIYHILTSEERLIRLVDRQPGVWGSTTTTIESGLSSWTGYFQVCQHQQDDQYYANLTPTRRDIFQEMLDSIKTPFPDCVKYLCENITLDPHFQEFYTWARKNRVPVIVLSSGMKPIIHALLLHLLGPEANEIEIVSNDVVDRAGMTKEQEGGWTIKFHDDSGFGHDKSLAIRPYAKHFAERPNEPHPTMLYAGDGVSDLSAASETDLLFAKKGRGE